MKKTILLFVFALMSAPMFAQSGLEFGLRINPEFTFILNKSDGDAGPVLDYAKHFSYASGGVGALYSINPHIGVGIDILFSREGQAFTGDLNEGSAADSNNYSSAVAFQKALALDTTFGEFEALSELNYIKLPLMFSYTSDRTKPIFFNVLVGPQFNFLEGVAQEVDGEDHEYPNTDLEPKDLYKSFVLNGMLAVGVGYNLGSHIVLTGHLRYDYGFADAENKDVTFNYSLFGITIPAGHFWAADRAASHSATASLLIGVNFKM